MIDLDQLKHDIKFAYYPNDYLQLLEILPELIAELQAYRQASDLKAQYLAANQAGLPWITLTENLK
jgi:hypothetical protein